MNEEELERIGKTLVVLLNLKVKDGKVETSLGKKSYIGLGAMIENVIGNKLKGQ